MALFNDATEIDSSRFNRQDLRYGFGLVFGEEGDPFVKAHAFFQSKSIPNPKILVLNPQSINQEEPFAVNITPTQDGGLVIEHRGQIVKNITIAGTTGFLPIQARVGLAQGGVPTGNIGDKSGYKDFLELRNLFKEYGRIKRTRPDIADQVKMVFLNGKDNESWIVEPQTFRMERSIPRKTLYRYQIPMVAVAKFDTSRRPTDFIEKPSDLSKTLQSISDASNAAENLFRDIEASASIFSNEVAKAADQILSPMTAFSTAANSVLTAQSTIVNIIPNTVNQATVAIIDFIETADAAAINLPTPLVESSLRTLNKLNNVQVRLDAFRATFPTQWETVTARWDQFKETMENRFRGQKSRRSMTSVKEEDVITGETIQRFAQRVLGDASRFMDVVILNKLRPPYIVGAQTNRLQGTVAPGDKLLVPVVASSEFSDNPISISIEGIRPTSTFEANAGAGSTVSTIEDTSQEWVINQWTGFTVEIIEGTGIGESRFIDSNTEDTLNVSPDWTTAPDASSVYQIYLDPIEEKVIPGAERVYGVDLLLTEDSDGLWDIRATPTSDVALIRGVDNLSQAIDIKFYVEPGELPMHPDFGFNAGIGSKGTLAQVLTAKILAVKTFLRDSRIESVDEISLEYVGSHLNLVSRITPKSSAPKFVDLTLPG